MTFARVASLARKLRTLSSRKTTAVDGKQDDFYIVEFPKSGVTWLSTIITNAALIASERPEVATFANVQFYIPDIHISRNVPKSKFVRPPVRFIKSHSEFNPNYQFVILLVRHPLDVMKSYYRFSNQRIGSRPVTFDEFCRDSHFGIPAWKRHTNSWISVNKDSLRMHFLRYEDLLAEPTETIALISENFGWCLSKGVIEEAVGRSNIDQMRRSEELYRTRAPHYAFRFVGAKDTSIESDRVALWIEDECDHELSRLGYKS